MRRILMFLAVTLLATHSFGQHARVRQYTAPLMGTVILKDVDDKYNAQVYNLEMPVPDAHSEKMKLRRVKEEIRKQYPYKKDVAQKKTTAALSPIVVKGFVADSFPGIPPDNDMAISKNGKAVSVINSSIAVLNSQTGQMTYRRGLKLFTNAVGLSGGSDYRYDPKVMYDPEADRFICVMLNSTNADNYIVIGFSKTNNPEGAWQFYKFYGDYGGDTTWFDYPCVSITKDEFFLTGNKIKYNTSWQAGFTQTVIYQVKKQDGYDAAANLTYQIWDSISYGGISIRNLYPVKGGSSIEGPAQYFLSNRNFDVQNDSIFLIKVPDIISSGNTNISFTVLKSPIKYGVPPNGRQPDTSVVLATNDGRVLGAYASGEEIQFVSTTLNTTTGASAVYHAKISNYKTAPAITYAAIYGVDTIDMGYPNISFSGNPWGLNQSLISFNYTGPNTYPGVGAILFNGVEYSDMVRVKEGDSSIKVLSGKDQRWGDYMGSQIDWNEAGSIWVLGIYGRKDKEYGNWMAKLNSPLLSIKENNSKTENIALYPNPANYYIRLDFTVEKREWLSFAVYNNMGQLVDKLIEQDCKTGKNMIQFDVASLPAGNYFLRASDKEGKMVLARSFVRQ